MGEAAIHPDILRGYGLIEAPFEDYLREARRVAGSRASRLT
jgi:hypothetical protein